MTARWPFWAATSEARFEPAFDHAEMHTGEHLIHLGCADGLLLRRAAAYRAARVSAVYQHAELAGRARALRDAMDVGATIIEADSTTIDLTDADVVFAYLSPATLQRLEAHIAARLKPTARLVTTGYAVPGWEPNGRGDRC